MRFSGPKIFRFIFSPHRLFLGLSLVVFTSCAEGDQDGGPNGEIIEVPAAKAPDNSTTKSTDPSQSDLSSSEPVSGASSNRISSTIETSQFSKKAENVSSMVSSGDDSKNAEGSVNESEFIMPKEEETQDRENDKLASDQDSQDKPKPVEEPEKTFDESTSAVSDPFIKVVASAKDASPFALPSEQQIADCASRLNISPERIVAISGTDSIMASEKSGLMFVVQSSVEVSLYAGTSGRLQGICMIHGGSSSLSLNSHILVYSAHLISSGSSSSRFQFAEGQPEMRSLKVEMTGRSSLEFVRYAFCKSILNSLVSTSGRGSFTCEM